MTDNKFSLTFVYPDFENLGIEYLMALGKKYGHIVNLVYYKAENAYLGKKKSAIPFNKIAQDIINTNPDLVLFSCVTDNYKYQLQCAKTLKKLKPYLANIFGGIHVTAVPDKVLKEKSVDAIAIGEAEDSFYKFLKSCQRKNNQLVFPSKRIKGIVFKKLEKVIGQYIEGDLVNLDSLPFPEKDLFSKNLKELKSRYTLVTSRGCPYSCNYCFHATICEIRRKKIVTQRSVENVIEELVLATKKYKFKIIYFVDDNFTTNKKWILKFLKLYKKKINIPFGCASHPERMDDEIADQLAKAGCIFITIGIQSLDQDICRQVINRIMNKEKIIKAIKSLKKVGIMVQVDHMFGIPGDTIKNQEDAITFYNEYRPDLISIFWLTYYPKTPIVEVARKQGILNAHDIENIEQGKKITEGSLHDGGSMKNPKPFYAAQLVLNYLPFLPKWFVKLLISSGWYRLFSIRNYYISTLLPRFLQSIFDKRYFWGRSLLVSLFNSD